MEYWMPYGNESISIVIPDSIDQKELAAPNQSVINNTKELLLSTFKAPIKTKPLKEMLQMKRPDSVVLVIDDHTRKFPHQAILPPLLSLLENQGIDKENITIFIASGVHRKPTLTQLEYMLGPEIVKGYKIDWNDQENGTFVDFGLTSTGTAVSFNEIYVNAEFKILVTDVTLHYFAGFGGDRKSIFPGVASSSSINKNHALVMNGIYPGIIKDNPIHKDMLEAAQMVGADFVINVSLDAEGRVLDIKSGALNHAFVEAVKNYQNTTRVIVKKQADLLILSAGGHPFDGNYQQSMKAIMQCKDAVKSGGKVLYFLEGKNGIGIPAFKKYLEQFSSSQSVLEHVQSHEYKQGMHNTYYYRKFTEEHEVYYVTKLPENYVNNTLKTKFVTDIKKLLSDLTQNTGLVYIIRHGTKMMVKFDPN